MISNYSSASKITREEMVKVLSNGESTFDYAFLIEDYKVSTENFSAYYGDIAADPKLWGDEHVIDVITTITCILYNVKTKEINYKESFTASQDVRTDKKVIVPTVISGADKLGYILSGKIDNATELTRDVIRDLKKYFIGKN